MVQYLNHRHGFIDVAVAASKDSGRIGDDGPSDGRRGSASHPLPQRPAMLSNEGLRRLDCHTSADFEFLSRRVNRQHVEALR